MLHELTVHNFAIIRDLEITFDNGLNVISGETGAGKSILIGAVNLILGSRASQEMIRTGTQEASVEATFLFADDSAAAVRRLETLGLEPAEALSIRRSISRSNKNRIFVNDQAVSLQQLQSLARGLISISGQHEHQLLLDSVLHLELLDNYGRLDPLCRRVREIHSEWTAVQEELRRLMRSRRERAEKLDYMRFQLQELEAARLVPGEDVDLEQERNLLRHAATLREAADHADQALYAGRGAVLEQLSAVEKDMEALLRIDGSLEPLSVHLQQARIHLEELVHGVQQYAHRITFDPQRLSAVEERLTQLQRLGKKYGGGLDAMLGRQEELKRELSGEDDADLREDFLNKSLDELRGRYLAEATVLSDRRREAARSLETEVRAVLGSLDMARARFEVRFHDTSRGDGGPVDAPFTASGIDRVEFLLSANPGEELKPLARVASGGELSRILLALKSLLGRQGEAETLVFDEVDAGIGGRIAELVGLQLKRLASRQQVICITHLPQIACYGEHHYRVAKETLDEETYTRIRLLEREERVDELSRMLGGIAISDTTRAHAEEILRRGEAGS
ncbi:MAG: DNA repair protein RecN [Syntrophobacteraceae bacterium]|nr:DNA repair protein RecN [Syntrophobacteraceae bacterium]